MADGTAGRRGVKVRPEPAWTEPDIVASPQVTFYYGQTAPKRRSLATLNDTPNNEGDARIPATRVPEMTEVTVFPVRQLERDLSHDGGALGQHSQGMAGPDQVQAASRPAYTSEPAQFQAFNMKYISTKSGEERDVRPITPIRAKSNGVLSHHDKKVVEFRQYAALFGIVGTYYSVYRDERKCLRKMFRLQRKLTYIAGISVLLGVYVNELCVAPDYLITDPSDAFVLETELSGGRTCDSSIGVYAKLGQSFLTIILLLMTVRRNHLKFKLHALRQHYSYTKKGHTPNAKAARAPKSLWITCALDLILTAIHTVPFVHIDIKVELLGKTMFYRLESIAAAVMLTRIIHVWRYVYLWSYFEYFDLSDSFLVRDTDTIQMLNQDTTNISRGMIPLKVICLKHLSTHDLKENNAHAWTVCDPKSSRSGLKQVLMAQHPFRAIVIILGIIFLALSYLLRIAEGPAYQPHSIYFWDQMVLAPPPPPPCARYAMHGTHAASGASAICLCARYTLRGTDEEMVLQFMIITQGSTGYGGTTPQTHLGRFACCVAMGLGPMTVAFLTGVWTPFDSCFDVASAAITRGLSLTTDEGVILHHMHVNKVRAKKVLAAVRILQFWWRENVINKKAANGPTVNSQRRYSSPLGASAMSAGSGLFARAMLITHASVANLTGRVAGKKKLLKRNRQLTSDFYWASLEVERIEVKEMDLHSPDARVMSAGAPQRLNSSMRSMRPSSAGLRRLRSAQQQVADARIGDMELKLDDVHATVRRIEEALRLLNVPGLERENSMPGPMQPENQPRSPEERMKVGARKAGDVSPWVTNATQSYADRKQEWHAKNREKLQRSSIGSDESIKMTNVVGRRFGNAGEVGMWSDRIEDHAAMSALRDGMALDLGESIQKIATSAYMPRDLAQTSAGEDGSVLVESFDDEDYDEDENAGGVFRRAAAQVRLPAWVPSQPPGATPGLHIGARAWGEGTRAMQTAAASPPTSTCCLSTERTAVESLDESQGDGSCRAGRPARGVQAVKQPLEGRTSTQGGLTLPPTVHAPYQKQQAVGGRLARISSSISSHLRGRRRLDRSTGISKRATNAVPKTSHKVHPDHDPTSAELQAAAGPHVELKDSGLGCPGRISTNGHFSQLGLCTVTAAQDLAQGALQPPPSGAATAGYFHPSAVKAHSKRA